MIRNINKEKNCWRGQLRTNTYFWEISFYYLSRLRLTRGPVAIHGFLPRINYQSHTNLCASLREKWMGLSFLTILEISLMPFLKHVYFDLHCFVQGNDHKRCSKIARKYYPGRGINWWPTTLESPDLTPNKNLMSSQTLTGSSLEFSKRQSPLASAIFACERTKTSSHKRPSDTTSLAFNATLEIKKVMPETSGLTIEFLYLLKLLDTLTAGCMHGELDGHDESRSLLLFDNESGTNR